MDIQNKGYFIEQSVVSEQGQMSQIQLKLYNNTEHSIRDWKLNFSLALIIHPDSITNGSLQQVGTNCLFTPEQSKHLEPGELFELRFKVNAQHLRNQNWGIMEAVILVNNKPYRTELSALSLLETYPQDSGKYSDIDASQYSVIPKPNKLLTYDCKVTLSKELTFSVDTEFALPAIKWLKDELAKHTEISLHDTNNGILTLSLNNQIRSDAYKLEIRERSFLLQAGGKAGFIHGCSTLLQLILSERLSLQLPCITIEDQPRYQYRGMMLDCARHFHSVGVIKRLLNQLAYYKYNIFHWHLTDDEGWRIEIDAYPELTETGAWRGPELILEGQYSRLSEVYGGYYTKSEIKEIIRYAEERGITVIPEIDIPGHCRAAIKSLPDLLVNPEDRSDYQSVQGYKDNILDPSLLGTYKFIDTVLEEVCALFPSPYIHIGGDEVPEGAWQNSEQCTHLMNHSGYSESGELQGHILRHAENRLKSLGKRMAGWEETHRGEQVSSDTIIYSWLSEEAAIKCANKGFDVVLQPAQYLYFDMAQGNDPAEPGTDWSNPISLNKVYNYEPLSSPDPSDEIHTRVLGIQCAIWSEFIPGDHQLEFMLYPRLLASAEIAWTQNDCKNWEEFLSRLKGHLPHLDNLKINYRSPWEV